MPSEDTKTSGRSSGSSLARTGQRLGMGLHTFVYRLTGGAVGGKMFNSPVLLLTTTGRKTGKQWTTPLLYIEDGGNLAVVASSGGSDRPPTWLLNLKSNPEAEVQIGRKTMRVRAEDASPEEKPRLWALLTKMYPPFDDYQKRTSREIPVVVLRPI